MAELAACSRRVSGHPPFRVSSGQTERARRSLRSSPTRTRGGKRGLAEQTLSGIEHCPARTDSVPCPDNFARRDRPLRRQFPCESVSAPIPGFQAPEVRARLTAIFAARCRAPKASRSDAEAPLLFLTHETCRHQLHQTRQVAVRQPMTGECPRPLD